MSDDVPPKLVWPDYDGLFAGEHDEKCPTCGSIEACECDLKAMLESIRDGPLNCPRCTFSEDRGVMFLNPCDRHRFRPDPDELLQ